ncbi:MAG TPA: hypothetical protein VD948_06040 [Rhodothermales bacterium]|nr:hypothetical protein [Rhodothermales bacterium]
MPNYSPLKAKLQAEGKSEKEAAASAAKIRQSAEKKKRGGHGSLMRRLKQGKC